MKNPNLKNRLGFTLLELITTTAMLATLTAACMVLVRTSYTAWNRHEDDHAVRRAGVDVLKHIVRQARQAQGVLEISLASETSGTLKLLGSQGNILVWEHDNGSKQVRFGLTTASSVLASNIEELNFVGYKLDGITTTTDPGLIHSVECTTKVNVPRPTGSETITTSNRAWLRAW